MPEDSSS